MNLEKSILRLIKMRISAESKLAYNIVSNSLTSVSLNALVAMALLHENEMTPAREIFDAFYAFFMSNNEIFQGIPRLWSLTTGLPDIGSICWEEDAAFLLLAFEFLKSITGSFDRYERFAHSIGNWLAQKAQRGDYLSADGVAASYAALKNFSDYSDFHQASLALESIYFSGKSLAAADFDHSLSHIIRSALVFGDFSKLSKLEKFALTEKWNAKPEINVHAYKNLKSDVHIDLSISAQLLLTLQLIEKKHFEKLKNQLKSELEKLWIADENNPEAVGLPLRVSNEETANQFSMPSLEPTCYFLFFLWGFNPFSFE